MMKRFALLLVVVLAACSSGSNGNSGGRVQIIPPEVDLQQLIGPAQLGYPAGPVEVRFAVRVANRSSEPITVRRIELTSLGSGAYRLTRREFTQYNEKIEPDGFTVMQMWARAYARGGPFALGTNEPVTIRGIVFFDTPFGPGQQIFVKLIPQDEGPRGRE